MKTRLAALLAETKRRESLNETALMAQRMSAASAQDAADWKVIEDFFNTAKETFTRLIEEQAPTKDLSILVGQTGNKEENSKVYHLFSLYSSNQAEDYIKRSKFFPLWRDFKNWATENGLVLHWNYCYDGGGMFSWYQLVCDVAPPSKR